MQLKVLTGVPRKRNSSQSSSSSSPSSDSSSSSVEPSWRHSGVRSSLGTKTPNLPTAFDSMHRDVTRMYQQKSGYRPMNNNFTNNSFSSQWGPAFKPSNVLRSVCSAPHCPRCWSGFPPRHPNLLRNSQSPGCSSPPKRFPKSTELIPNISSITDLNNNDNNKPFFDTFHKFLLLIQVLTTRNTVITKQQLAD